MNQGDYVNKHKLKRQIEPEVIFKMHWRHERYSDNAYLMKDFLYLVTKQFPLNINRLSGRRQPYLASITDFANIVPILEIV